MADHVVRSNEVQGLYYMTPADARIKLRNFNARVDRLLKNEYSDPRFRKMDLNLLRREIRGHNYWISIGRFMERPADKKKVIHLLGKSIKSFHVAYEKITVTGVWYEELERTIE